MRHLDEDAKTFYDWAVKKLAEETRVEELAEFAERFPPDELKRIYSTLDEEVIPTLARNGVPITREEIFKMFRTWFVKMASPEAGHSYKSPDYGTEPEKLDTRLIRDIEG